MGAAAVITGVCCFVVGVGIGVGVTVGVYKYKEKQRKKEEQETNREKFKKMFQDLDVKNTNIQFQLN